MGGPLKKVTPFYMVRLWSCWYFWVFWSLVRNGRPFFLKGWMGGGTFSFFRKMARLLFTAFWERIGLHRSRFKKWAEVGRLRGSWIFDFLTHTHNIHAHTTREGTGKKWGASLLEHLREGRVLRAVPSLR